MIELNNVNKNFKKKKKELIILKDLNYNFSSSKLYCIIGKSGAGKSTLVQMLGLLCTQTSGDIIINGKKIKNLSENQKSYLRNKKIGFIFQSFYLNPLMTALENVMIPMYLDKKLTNNQIKEKAKNLLISMGLEERINHYPKELSGGEQQRVAIARALSNNPDIILADEPTGSLDTENEIKILEILKELSKNGKCVIVVSHNDIVKKYADKVLIIQNKNLKEIS